MTIRGLGLSTDTVVSFSSIMNSFWVKVKNKDGNMFVKTKKNA